VAERYFERAEVEALIPTLARVMGQAMGAHQEATGISEKLDAERERIGLAGGGVLDQAAWKADIASIASLTETVKAALGEIEAMGGVTKDLALGLVDFPHMRDGRVVNLCWKFGERAVDHWHGLDEGYGSRKPL
jgi:hypothetical protein